MKKEALEDYEKKEIERQGRHYKNVLSTVVKGPVVGYPSSTSFSALHDPLVLADTSTYIQYGEKIWSQIPFAGTLIIPLNVATEENFLRFNSFDRNDITNLLTICERQGKSSVLLEHSS